MSEADIDVTIADQIAHVRLAAPDGRNSLSAARMRELTRLARAFREDTNIAVIILSGDPNFSAGVDLKDPELWSGGRTRLQQRQIMALGPDLCAAWEAVEQPTICAIEGYCIGGGMALALACDWRVMGASARYSLPEVPLGMNMSWQANPRLTALVGPAKAKELVILGEACPAPDAHRMGLAEAVVADGQALAWAQARAEKIRALPPIAVRMSKQAINAHANALNYASSFMDRDQFAFVAGSKDQREALQAFREKRPAKFTGD
jgi:enoyl-CoA hydratase